PALFVLNTKKRPRKLSHGFARSPAFINHSAKKERGHRKTQQEELQRQDVLFGIRVDEDDGFMKVLPDGNDRNHKDRPTGSSLTKADCSPQHEWERRIKERRQKAT